MTKLPSGYFWDTELKQGQETAELSARVWPNYLIEPSDIPDPGLKLEISLGEFARRFPVWGIREKVSSRLVAFANAAQLAIDPNLKSLPQEGWRFAIQAAAKKEKPNCLCLLVINVDPQARGQGLARILIERAKLATLEMGFKTMIAPVRPTHHPDVSWDNDPWVNLHRELGATVVNVCESSVLIKASLNQWRKWTGLKLLAQGETLARGFAPLELDLENDCAIYREPNLWLRYQVS